MQDLYATRLNFIDVYSKFFPFVNLFTKFFVFAFLVFAAHDAFADTSLRPFTVVGFGEQAEGGYGGERILITSLDGGNPPAQCPDPDGVPGGAIDCTLREAVKKPHRHIEFAVSGTITLNPSITISEPYITVDGSTAPRGGIQFRADPNVGYASQIIVDANHVIVRHLRFRHGAVHIPGDGLEILGGSNIVIDHVSCQWGGDECISFQSDRATSPVENVTLQHSFLGETLDQSEGISNNSKASLVSGNTKGITFYRNLFALNRYRNPQIAPGYIYHPTGNDNYSGIGEYEIVENIVYGQYNSHYVAALSATWHTKADIIRNLYLASPQTPLPRFPVEIILRITPGYFGEMYGPVSVYVKGNIINQYRPTNITPDCDVTILLSDLSPPPFNGPCNAAGIIHLGQPALSSSPLIDHQFPGDAASGLGIYESVLRTAGAILPCRDSVDTRIVAHVRNRTGIYVNSSPDEVGGYPDLTQACSPPTGASWQPALPANLRIQGHRIEKIE